MNRSDGIANFVMNVYRRIDRSKYQFDFLVMEDQPGEYDPEIEALGGRIYHADRLSSHLLRHTRQVYQLMKHENYLALHRHTAVSLSWPDFYAAKKAGVQNRICHSHGTTCTQMAMHKLFYPLFHPNITHRLACGEAAGKWLYRAGESFQVQKNGVDTERFQFDAAVRAEQRNALGADKDTLIVGSVGRLAPEKNQALLLDAFSEVRKRRENSLLILLGVGPLEEALKNQAEALGIADHVLFPGVTDDVPRWLDAMDVAVYPSLFEAFPISVLEGEASGLATVISDHIPLEVDVLGKLIQMPLEQDKSAWADAILSAYECSKTADRQSAGRQVLEAGYDIQNTAKQLEQFYDTLR